VLITGGAGFIGRALVARCLEAGHTVSVIDNLCAGTRENLRPFLGSIGFHEIDVLDADAVQVVMEQARPRIVFHLAAHHYIPFCDAHPRETLRVNVEGTWVVLAAAVQAGAEVAVVASTGAFYPSREELLTEDLEAAPVDVYGLSKHMAEQVTRFVGTTTQLSCLAVRLFNTYGPHETNPHLIPHIIDSIRRGSTVALGNIHTRRDYVYVDDVADLLYRCARRAPEDYTVVNVGTGTEYSAEEIVAHIGDITGRALRIDVDDARIRQVDKLHQRADVRRLLDLTGARPEYGIVEGLQRLLEHEGL
jgi:UDP-glucose 4-epimerase